MPLQQSQPDHGSSHSFTVALARDIHEVREAQRLRYRVFAQEMGARVPGREQGIDCDIYDAYCDHLLVRDSDTGEVIGTYRILNGAQARRLGGFYSDEEFDLTRLNAVRDLTVEVGRSCVHPDYRGGGAISMLWSGLGAYVVERRYQYLIGCASIGLADGGRGAAGVYRRLQETSLSPAEYRAFPRLELPFDLADADAAAPVPALIKGYVRLGSYVCGAPAWDPDFNTADLLMLLPLARVNFRYARHFLKGASS
jgi:putative hemolysin